MAEIFIFKYGESIYIDEKTKQIELKNPITDIIVNTIPTNYTFSAACIIMDFDYEKENNIRYELKNKEGIILHKDEINTTPWKPKKDNDKCTGLNLGIDFRNVMLKNDETLTTYMYFNDKLIGSYPINVIKKVGD